MDLEMQQPMPGATHNVAVLVWVELPPGSLRNCGWSQPFKGTELWRYCVAQLGRDSPAPVIVAGPPGSIALQEECKGLNVSFIRGASQKQALCWSEVAARYGASSLVVVHGLLGAGLTPATLVGGLIRAYADSNNDVTIVADLPPPLYAAAFGPRVLEMLHVLPRQLLLRDEVSLIVDTLESAIGNDTSHGGIQVQRLPFASFFDTALAGLPSFIPWTYNGDVTRIERALGESAPNGPAAALARLRELLIDSLDVAHRPRPPARRRATGVSRVLFASNPSAYSGAEQSLANTIRSLQGSGVEIHCLIGHEGVFADRVRSAGAVVHCPNRDCAALRVDTMLMVDELVEWLAPDLIHSNGAVGFPLLAVSRLRGIPLVEWVRIAELGGVIDHLLCADMLTAVSNFIAQIAVRQMVRAGKVRVLYDCIDTDRFSPLARPATGFRAKHGISAEDFILLCIARFVPYKRHDILIRATAMAAGRHPNLRLVLVGDPQLDAHTYQQTLEGLRLSGLLPRTTLLGFQHDVLDIEAASDAVVLCSEREPLGTVVLESMALAKPVIVAASGGLVEMVEDEVSGLHCPPNDAGSLSRQICRLIESPGLRETLGTLARRRAVERFSMREHARRLLMLYQELSESCQYRNVQTWESVKSPLGPGI
jgi:glycosyltransferase involved in cell wall biosynthesis